MHPAFNIVYVVKKLGRDCKFLRDGNTQPLPRNGAAEELSRDATDGPARPKI